MWRAARYIGTVLALGFVATLVWRSAAEIPPLDLSASTVWLGLLGGFALYGASQFIGASAWRATLRVYDVHLPRGRAESQLLVSQIGKYIPGNIAHLLGRAVLARADGVAGASIAGAMLLEVAFLLIAAILIVGAMLLGAPGLMALLAAGLPEAAMGWPVAAAALAITVCVAAGQLYLWRRAGRPRLVLARVIQPVALHLSNFAVLGVSLWSVALVVAPQSGPATGLGIGHCVAIFATAWVAGFLLPGAPGGVGMRDGIIAIGLELFMAPGAALAAALLHRAASVLGDVTIFGIGMVMRQRFGVASAAGRTGATQAP